jgi:hypothetical protein
MIFWSHVLPCVCGTERVVSGVVCCRAIHTDVMSGFMRVWVSARQDSEDRPVSKYANGLIQLDNGIKISMDPSTWRCADSGLAENLWLNLSTGYIGSGRAQYGGKQWAVKCQYGGEWAGEALPGFDVNTPQVQRGGRSGVRRVAREGSRGSRALPSRNLAGTSDHDVS